MTSDYGEFCKEMRSGRKKAKEKAFFKAHEDGGLVEQIENMGAVKMTDGVWRLGNDDIYPYRGWVRNYRNNKGCSIRYWLEHRKDLQCSK